MELIIKLDKISTFHLDIPEQEYDRHELAGLISKLQSILKISDKFEGDFLPAKEVAIPGKKRKMTPDEIKIFLAIYNESNNKLKDCNEYFKRIGIAPRNSIYGLYNLRSSLNK